ncbi:MAG TPA: hypothetical protein VGJ70_12795, partial [Solirubrobacteraceae bacterium]
VPGFNAGRFGSGTKCVGCHVGHSAIPVAESYALGKRFNAAPSAAVSATSEVPGTRARSVVDRRTRGRTTDVAWVANGLEGEAVTLRWSLGLALDSLVVYGIRPEPAAGTDVAVDGCDVELRRDERVVGRLRLSGGVSPSGSGVACGGRIVDVVVIHPVGARGRIAGVERAGLAEVEARARIPED